MLFTVVQLWLYSKKIAATTTNDPYAQWRQRLTNIGDDWNGPERGAGGTQRRSVERLGFGEGRSSPFLNFSMHICILMHFCANHYAKLYAQLARYVNQFIVLDSTLRLEWIQPTSWPIAMHKYFCGAAAYKRNFGRDIRYSVPRWPNIAGEASPVASVPLRMPLWAAG